MKKHVLSLIAIVGIATATFAQQAELKAAQANIESKKYIAAFENLNQAKLAITELISKELGSVLPASFGEFTQQPSERGGGMESQGVSINKTYRKPTPKADPSAAADKSGEAERPEMRMPDPDMGMDPAMAMMQMPAELSVQITTNMMMANEVLNAHSMSEGGSMDPNQKAVRVKGYRAVLKSYGGEGEGRGEPGMGQSQTEVAMAIVGGAFIQVEARGLKEKGQAEKFLGLIDFDKLKGIVGE